MKLNSNAITEIEQGIKSAEIRLYDDKRRLVNISDYIIFTDLSNENRQLKTQVLGLTIAKDFKTLFELIDPVLGGWTEGTTPAECQKDMLVFYSNAEMEKYGVLAIHLKVA